MSDPAVKNVLCALSCAALILLAAWILSDWFVVGW